MIPRIAPDLTLREVRALLAPRSGVVEEFEESFARWSGWRAAVAMPSARWGLKLALEDMCSDGGEVLTPAYTCAAVPQAILSAGFLPRLVEILRDDFQCGAEALARARTPRTRAAVLTPLYGIPPADPGALLEATRGLERIWDCALAPGFRRAFARDEFAVNAAGALYSLNFGKPLTALGGGVFASDDILRVARVRERRDAALSPSGFRERTLWTVYGLAGYLALRPSLYRIVDWFERNTDLLNPIDPASAALRPSHPHLFSRTEAAVGLIQLDRADEILARQNRHARTYLEKLAREEKIGLPTDRLGASWTHFPVRFPDAPAARRALARRGISVGAPWSYALSDLDPWRPYAASGCPEASRAAREVLCLPVLSSLSDELVDEVCEAVLAICRIRTF